LCWSDSPHGRTEGGRRTKPLAATRVIAAFEEAASLGWELDVVVADAVVQLFGREVPRGSFLSGCGNRPCQVNPSAPCLAVKHAIPAFD